MIRFFLFLLFFSHEVIASVTGKTLICDNNTRGYHFISEKKVNVLSINLDELTIITIEHFYELTENAIFIKQPFDLIEKKDNLRSKPIGWIFRRNLDYVQSKQDINGDWNQKFLWNCEVTKLQTLILKINNKLKKIRNNRSN
jgi:hypothetical protein